MVHPVLLHNSYAKLQFYREVDIVYCLLFIIFLPLGIDMCKRITKGSLSNLDNVDMHTLRCVQ